MTLRSWQRLAWLWLCLGALPTTAEASAKPTMPRYDHIFVVIEENHTTNEIIGSPSAPFLTRLSKDYGFASNYYGIRHPSEPNYIALVGGDTFGIADDDAFYCKPHDQEVGCDHASKPGYVDHTVQGPNLTDQLRARGLDWKGYFEDLPSPTSWRWPSPAKPVPGKPESLYAVKHNGFMSFADVQNVSDLKEHIVGFDVLERDVARGALPAFAHIVPNQCNDMHGLKGHDVPVDCNGWNSAGLIARADCALAHIVGEIMNSASWKGADNDAVVITFDENDDDSPSPRPDGCCGYGPGNASNPGGGWIPTIVVTNHGPRRLVDPTPYNHYSLLRTIEDAFGLREHLRHAGDDKSGVSPMTALFAVKSK